MYYVLSLTDDLATAPKKVLDEIINDLRSYPPFDPHSIEAFDADHMMDDDLTQKEISRTTKPLLEWCRQVSLLGYVKPIVTQTEQGEAARRIYSAFRPVWFHDLQDDAEEKTALLLIHNLAKLTNQALGVSRFDRAEKNWIREIDQQLHLFVRGRTQLKAPLDFDLHYDIS